MPVEIKEMIIKAVIEGRLTSEEGDALAKIQTQNDSDPLSFLQREDLIEECVQRVLHELEKKLRD